MKKLILAAAVVASTTTNAADFEAFDMKAMCAGTQESVQHFTSYGMDPVLLSEASMVVDPDVPQLPGSVVLWRNSDNGNFTVTFTPASNLDVTCVLTYGEALYAFESGI